VIWEDGQAKPASSNVGDFPPMSFKELAAKKALTGGPTTAAASVNADGMAPGFSTQFCDVDVNQGRRLPGPAGRSVRTRFC